MSNYADLKYAGLVSSRLELFKVKRTNPYQASFRCPICGDSQKSDTKTRGSFSVWKGGSIGFHCFNCGESLNLYDFIKKIDPTLASAYLGESGLQRMRPVHQDTSEMFRPSLKSAKADLVSNKLSKRKFLKGLTPIQSLDSSHPIVEYTKKRMIPENQWRRLYFVEDYNNWVNGFIPDKLPSKIIEPRLVLPFIWQDGTVFGASGRGFNPKGIRYIHSMFDEDYDKVFGMDCCDIEDEFYITEGQIDSLFFENAISMAGADLSSNVNLHKDKAIFVFDAEPRNTQIIQRMTKIISAGYRVVIWPKSVPGKDVNEMVLSGYDFMEAIKCNTYHGLEATLKLAEWRKN